MKLTLNLENNIRCTISTPEFKDGKVFFYKRQDGILDIVTLKFTPNNLLFGYTVQFHCMEDFAKAVKKIYLD